MYNTFFQERYNLMLIQIAIFFQTLWIYLLVKEKEEIKVWVYFVNVYFLQITKDKYTDKIIPSRLITRRLIIRLEFSQSRKNTRENCNYNT